jgi:hypothetical protein
LILEQTISSKKITAIRKELLTGLLTANCIFCRWGVKFIIKDLSTSSAVIDLKEFKGDNVYAPSCIKEVKQSLPPCYIAKQLNKDFFLIRFNDNIIL